MKKKSISVLFVLMSTLFSFQKLSAQHPVYAKVIEALRSNYPSETWNDKVLALTTWNTENNTSRDINRSFAKTHSVYRVAKLKGGAKGMLLVTVCLNAANSQAIIVLNKDGVSNSIVIPYESLSAVMDTNPANWVFDSSGKLLFGNLMQDQVQESIHGLITR